MVGRIKLLFVLLLMAALSVLVYNSMDIKDRSIRELYEDVTFMRITMDARQYISQIEYGIKNGRQLDNFYNMQENLKLIQSCSSYMEGAYIVSAEGRLLYQSGLKAEGLGLTIPEKGVFSKGRLYSMKEGTERFFLTAPIKDKSGNIAGYLIMCISENAVINAVSDYNRENRVQSVAIALEILGIAILVIKRLRPNFKKQIALKLVVVAAVAVTSSAVLDSALVFTRFYQIVDDAARQSANKMAQALQSEVDSVIAKGVPAERIYDLNGWLAKNSSELDIVTSLTLDRNNKITANVSKAYINSFFYRLLFRTLLLIAACVLCSLAACGMTVLLRRLFGKKKKTVEMRGMVNA